jgi:D-alanyl-D-alanine carboxypeptidase/D-alanyl-D-alanine-endopeptidase (penicillin-binding protein 4)
VAVVVALFAAAAGVLVFDQTPDSPLEVAPPSGLSLPTAVAATPLGTPALVRSADPAAVRRALAPALRDKHLGGDVVALVGSLGSTAPAFASGQGLVAPASSLKLLTSAAALSALGPGTTFTTSVVSGRTARDIVLVGGGDPYLDSKPDTTGAAYPQRADVTTLAKATAAALKKQGVRSVRLDYDASLFTGPAVNPRWPADYVTDSVVTPISALWVDKGLLADGFHRTDDPAGQAARVFAAALARYGVKVAGAPAPTRAASTATRLAAVTSAPVDEIVQEVLQVSDNEGAEVLLRHVGLAVSGQGSFTAGVAGVKQTLAGLGVPLTGATLYDGSGLSRDDRLAARTLLAVVSLAASAAHPELRAVVEGLPVAAFSGSLEDRFGDGAAAGRGWVRAKTGTLTGVSALVGLAQDLDGGLLPFLVVADEVKPEDTLDARAALDRAASALAACHCSR